MDTLCQIHQVDPIWSQHSAVCQYYPTVWHPPHFPYQPFLDLDSLLDPLLLILHLAAICPFGERAHRLLFDQNYQPGMLDNDQPIFICISENELTWQQKR